MTRGKATEADLEEVCRMKELLRRKAAGGRPCSTCHAADPDCRVCGGIGYVGGGQVIVLRNEER